MTGATLVSVTEPTQVSVARRSGADIAGALDFDETAAGTLALAITEAGTNLLKHAGGGEVVLRWRGDSAPAWVELLALDRGPGMPNVARCLEDGFSTSGSPGTGLGALRRLASVFDVYSRPGLGTALVARVNASTIGGTAPAARALDVEAIAVPKPGEDVCGDAFAEQPRVDGTTLIVVDGLGHGPGAADAARVAVAAFRGARGRPAQRLEAVHQALRATRGAAVAIADVDVTAGVVRFAGLGNIAGRIHAEGAVQNMVSQPGTAGHLARKIDEYTYRLAAGAVLVMHSDGLTAHHDLGRYPGLAQRHPALIAGVLLRDARRERDDAVVAVARASR